jgi:hypothetical protein
MASGDLPEARARQLPRDGLPILIAGITTAHFGLPGTALAYSAAVAGLAAAAAGTFVSRASSHRPAGAARGGRFR